MKKTFYMTLMMAFIITGFLFPSLSESQEKAGDQVYQLGEIVVSTPNTGVEAIGTVRVVTAQEIKASGAKTLGEAISLLPGIIVRTGGDGVPRPDLRGMKPRDITLLIDGIPFNSAGDGQFDPRLITTENIAEIKISYGNDSVLYGPGGLGGVINVITKKGTEKTKFDVQGRLAERDNQYYSASLSGAKERMNYFISASDYSSDGYPLSGDFTPTPYQDGGVRNNSDQRLRSFFGNLGFSPNDKSQVGLIVNYIGGGQYGIPPITVDKTDPFGKNVQYERVSDRKGISSNLSGSYDLDGPLSFRGWVFVNNYQETDNGYDDDTYSTQTKNKSYSAREKSRIRGGTLQAKYVSDSLGTLSMSIGTKYAQFDSVGWEVGKKNTTSFDQSPSIVTNTAAAEYDVQPFEKMGFVAGYGYSWFKKENDLSDSTGYYLIGLNYELPKNSRIKASVADKVRFPSVTQLYGVGEGNPDLKYEKSMNYELGFEQILSRYATAFSITGFIRDVDNFISKDSNGVNQNAQKYLYQGVEIMAANRSIENLDLRLGYTYMDTKDKSPGSLVDDIQYNPRHKLTLQGTYNFGYDISAYASVEYIADQYYYNSDDTLEGELPNYTLVNLKINKRFPSKKLTLFVGVTNLFDRNYFDSYALPREGRNIYGGLSFAIE